MSKEVNHIVELKTYDSQKSLIFEKLGYAHEYFNFDIRVQSGDFSGKQFFCISQKSFEQFLQNLKRMIQQLSGSIEVMEEYETHVVRMELDRFGHLTVTGEFLFHSPPQQYLKFGFITDQTCLQPLYNDLSDTANNLLNDN